MAVFDYTTAMGKTEIEALSETLKRSKALNN